MGDAEGSPHTRAGWEVGGPHPDSTDGRRGLVPGPAGPGPYSILGRGTWPGRAAGLDLGEETVKLVGTVKIKGRSIKSAVIKQQLPAVLQPHGFGRGAGRLRECWESTCVAVHTCVAAHACDSTHACSL